MIKLFVIVQLFHYSLLRLSRSSGVVVLLLLMGSLNCGAITTFRDDPDYLINTWETEDGLPENSATAMVQDRDGYLWFGTFGELVRFDGVKFDVVPVPLPGTGVVNIHLDRADRLWVSMYSGLAVREGGRWRTLSSADGWTGDLVRTFSERADGQLLITTFNGRVLVFAEQRFTELPPPPGEKNAGYLGAVDSSGKWCVVQNRFVGTWDGGKWEPLIPPDELARDANNILGVAPARDGGTWLLVGKTIRKLRNGVETSRITLTDFPGGIWSMFEDSAGQLWISSYNSGLTRVSPDGAARRWTLLSGSHRALRFAFEDRENNIWVGTSGGGLQRFKPRRFRTFGPKEGMKEPNITSLSPAGRTVWAASYGGGLCRIENGKIVPAPRLPGTMDLQSVLCDRAGRVWVGAFNQPLNVLENGVPRQIPIGQTGGGNVIALFEDSRGRIWLSGGKGIVMHDGENVRLFPPIDGVSCISEDDAGAIWLGNDAGAFRIEGDQYVALLHDGKPVTGVSCLYNPSLAEGGEKPVAGELWIYSRSAGLLLWKNGLTISVPYSGPPVYGMVQDLTGNLWMPTARGIVRRCAPGSTGPEFMTFDVSDGLPTLESAGLRQPVCGRDATGLLWFASQKGVASMDPAQLRPNLTPPDVRFESVVYRVLRDGQEVETRIDAPFEKPLVLPPESRRIEFHFTAPGFSSPEKMQFAMRLENPDTAEFLHSPSPWINAGSRRVIEFFERPHGKYTLYVRGANNDGVWSETATGISFTVQPYYWQTVWFGTAVALGLLALGGGFTWRLMRFRHSRMEERLALQQQRGELAHLGRVASMSELSGSLAHELNQPLTAILSNAQAAHRFLHQNPPDLAEVSEIITDIVGEGRRAGEVIRRMRRMLKKEQSVMEMLQLNDLAGEVLSMIRSDLVARNATAVTGLAPDLPRVYGDRIQLQQVILNLLINACDAMSEVHAARRLLTVTTAVSEDGPVLSVRDQGFGLAPGTEEKIFEPFYSTKAGGLGMGLAICRSILSAHGGRLTAQNHPDGGAVLRMVLPPGKKTHD